MSVFAALFYTSAREIPTLLCTSSLKKYPWGRNKVAQGSVNITISAWLLLQKKNEYIVLFRSERSEGAGGGGGGGGGFEGTNSRLLFFATQLIAIIYV